MEILADDRQQAADGIGVGFSQQLVALAAPQRDRSRDRCRVVGEQPLSHFFQTRAAQPGRPGQVIPVSMQAGERQTFVEWIFYFEPRRPVVFGMADVQRLVQVGHQMQQPGQGIGGRLVRAMPQHAVEAFDLVVRLAALTPALLKAFDGWNKALLDDALAHNGTSCALSNFPQDHRPDAELLRAITRDLAAAWREFALELNARLVAAPVAREAA